MLIKTRCIVLRTVKYGDNKLIIDLLTEDEGRASVVWKVTTSAKARIRRQFFQPLTILEVDYERTPRQALAQLKDARLAHLYTSLPFDGTKLSIAFFLAEFLSHATRNQHADATLYNFIEQNLLWLDVSNRGIANFHIMFTLRLSLFLGFHPDLESYSEGSCFDLREGRFTHSIGFHNDVLNPMESAKMITLMRMNTSNLHLFRMTHLERNAAIESIITFYQLHIPDFGELKSLEVLKGMSR